MAKIVEGGGEEPVFEVTPEQLAFIQELKGERAVLAPGVTGGGLKEATILSSLSGAWTEFRERILNPTDPNGFEVARPNCTFQFVGFSVEVILGATTITGLPNIGIPGPRIVLSMSLNNAINAIGFPSVPPSVFLIGPNATWDGAKWVYAPGDKVSYSTTAFAEPTYKNLTFVNPYCLGLVDVSYLAGGVPPPPYSINNLRLKITWPFWDPPGAPDITFSCTTVPYPQPPDELATFQWFASKYIYGTPGRPDCFGEFRNFLFTNKYP